MGIVWCCFLASVALVPTLVAEPGADQDLAAIERAAASVLKIDAYVFGPDGKQTATDVGTAFVVHPTGIVVTCNHVVRRSCGGLVQTKNGVISRFSVLARVPQYDLAFLQTDPPVLAPSVTPRIGSACREGERVFTISNLLARGLATTRGAIAASGYRLRTDSVAVDGALLLDMTIARGSSGAPVLDSQSRLVGYVVSRVDEKLNLNDALCTAHLVRACEELVNLRGCRGLAPGLRVEHAARGVSVAAIEAPGLDKELRVGDKITRVEDWPIASLVDYHLSTLAWANRGTKRPLRLTIARGRDDAPRTVNVPVARCVAKTLDRACPGEQGMAITVKATGEQKDGNASGILLTAQVQSLGLLMGLSDQRPCQVSYRAELNLPAEGSYTFYLACAGTGRLEVGESLVVEKKLEHPPMLVAGRAYLSTGFHRLSLLLEGKGPGEKPPVLVDGPGMSMFRPLPDEWLRMPVDEPNPSPPQRSPR